MSTTTDGIREETGRQVKEGSQLANIPLPKCWRIIAGSRELLDTGFLPADSTFSHNPPILIFEKKNETHLQQQSSINSSYELFRVAIYAADLLLNKDNDRYFGPKMVFFYRIKDSEPKVIIWNVKPYSREEYGAPYAPLSKIDTLYPGIFLDGAISAKETLALGSCQNLETGTDLLWPEKQYSVGFPMHICGTFWKKLVLNFFFENGGVTREEFDYFLKISGDVIYSTEEKEAYDKAKAEVWQKIAMDDWDLEWQRELKKIVQEAHRSTYLKYEENGKYLDYSSLAYDLACVISEQAPHQIDFALDLLKIITCTLDWRKSEVMSPYAYIALSKAGDIILNGNFGSPKLKRSYIRENLSHFISLDHFAAHFEVMPLQKMLAILCGLDPKTDADNPLLQDNIPIAETVADKVTQVMDIFMTLAKMCKQYKNEILALGHSVPEMAKEEDREKKIEKDEGKDKGKDKEQEKDQRLQDGREKAIKAAKLRLGIQSNASEEHEEKEGKEGKERKDKAEIKTKAEVKAGSEIKARAETIATPSDLKVVAGDINIAESGMVLLKRNFSAEPRQVPVEPWQKKVYEHYQDFQVQYIGVVTSKIQLGKDKYSEKEFTTVSFIFGNPQGGRKFQKDGVTFVYNDPFQVESLESPFKLLNYQFLVPFASHYWVPHFKDQGKDFEGELEKFLNKEWQVPEMLIGRSTSPRIMKHFSLQIGRMPKVLCKQFFDFLVTRGVMPAHFSDFLMRFATGHELSYSEETSSSIRKLLGDGHYRKAVLDAEKAIIEPLQSIVATRKEHMGDDPDWSCHDDSSLCFDLACNLEQLSPLDALDALRIIIDLERHKGNSAFWRLAVDKFCNISLALVKKGDEKDLPLLEESIRINLKRILKLSKMESIFTLIDQLEAYCGVILLDRKAVRERVTDPEVIANQGEVLSFIMSKMADLIYQARNALEIRQPLFLSQKSMSYSSISTISNGSLLASAPIPVDSNSGCSLDELDSEKDEGKQKQRVFR